MNVYVAELVLSIVAGDQVPVTPFVEVAGSVGGTEPVQIGPIAAKVGVTFELIVTVRVVLTAHWPAEGIKV